MSGILDGKGYNSQGPGKGKGLKLQIPWQLNTKLLKLYGATCIEENADIQKDRNVTNRFLADLVAARWGFPRRRGHEDHPSCRGDP
jgi:hypothetical protein